MSTEDNTVADVSVQSIDDKGNGNEVFEKKDALSVASDRDLDHASDDKEFVDTVESTEVNAAVIEDKADTIEAESKFEEQKESEPPTVENEPPKTHVNEAVDLLNRPVPEPPISNTQGVNGQENDVSDALNTMNKSIARRSTGFDLNILSTSSTNLDVSNKEEPEDLEVDDDLVDMDTIKTDDLSVEGMSSMDSYDHKHNAKKGDSAKVKSSGIDEIIATNVQEPSTDNNDNSKGGANWFEITKPEDNLETKVESLLIDEADDSNLIKQRFKSNKTYDQSISSKDRELFLQGHESIKKTFQEVKTGVEYTNQEELIQRIDWEFWSKVVNDYDSLIEDPNNDKILMDHITRGIPEELRGLIWQTLCDSKSIKYEDFYHQCKMKSSVYEKQIKRDLSRTSFVKQNGQIHLDELLQVIKAYSLFDEEVGYTQGMAFLTVPILLNMDSSECFCLLNKLMFQYGFREFYLPEMPGLKLRMYQLDRLIEDKIPDLSYHFKKEGIKSTMYATQWFLTLFGYKFPLELVLRVFDVVIAQGLESILQLSINLLVQNKDMLLQLKFEELLNCLKEGLFEKYRINTGYNIDLFVKDAMSIQLSSMQLNKYRKELETIDALESANEREISDLRIQNGQLTRQIREIEQAYSILNKEHVEIANEMVKGKMRIGSLEDEKAQLEEAIEDLKQRLQKLESVNGHIVDFSGELDDGINFEIQKAMQRNLEVMEENVKLEEQLASLEEENENMKKHIHASGGGLFGIKKSGKFW